MRALIVGQTSPRFFALWTALEQSEVRDLSYLRVGEREFIAVLLSSTRVSIFEISGTSFVAFQNLSSSSPLGIAAFSFDGSHSCIAVASDTSAVYCWSSDSLSFEKIQDIYTPKAVNVEFLTIISRHFLVFSCNGSDSQISSLVYLWQSNRFHLIQYLPTVSAVRATFQSSSTGEFLVVAQSTIPSSSLVFKWNETHFADLQSFDSSTTFPFSIGDHVFIASGSAIHRYSPAGNTFIEHSSLQGYSDGSIRSYEFFSTGSESYLVVSSQSSTIPGTVTIHRHTGAGFLPYQSLPSPGVDVVVQGFQNKDGRQMLALSSLGDVSFYEWISHITAS